ncbi:hypothetical protein [Paraburkholderia hayleyella]|uniref:hypothetical protein n=1 Tax=Paraburkholderia hayleyella TaxID=2152889 RepID=UPI00129176AF|nr:hypothetical protein [Paraburkholderia hayleyella]
MIHFHCMRTQAARRSKPYTRGTPTGEPSAASATPTAKHTAARQQSDKRERDKGKTQRKQRLAAWCRMVIERAILRIILVCHADSKKTDLKMN